MERGGTSPSPGDAALAALLSVHNLAMNGGLLHSVDSHSPTELDAAVEGFRYFGLVAAADAVRWTVGAARTDLENDLDEVERVEVEADRRYDDAIPDDATIYDAFAVAMETSPEAFNPG